MTNARAITHAGARARLDVQRQVLALATAHAEAAVAAVPLRGRLRQALHAHGLPHLRRGPAPEWPHPLHQPAL